MWPRIRSLLTRSHNGFKNLHVSRAAAKIACQTISDLSLTRTWNSLEQIHRGQHHTGRANAALSAAMFDECLLDCVQLAITWRNSFDCFDRGATNLGNGNETTVDDPSVDHHRAGAALAFAATLFRSSQAKLFAQHVQQPLDRIRVHGLRLSIDGELDLSFLSQGSFVTPGGSIAGHVCAEE